MTNWSKYTHNSKKIKEEVLVRYSSDGLIRVYMPDGKIVIRMSDGRVIVTDGAVRSVR